MSQTEWIHDERLSQIDVRKLSFLQKLLFEMNELSEDEKLPFLLALASSTRSNPIHFSSEEVNLITNVISSYADEKDKPRIRQITSLFALTN